MKLQTALDTRLCGSWLTLAWTAWGAFLLLTLGIYLVGIPARYHDLLAVCAGVECVERQLTPEKVQALQQLGLSLSAYATYIVTLEVVVGLFFTLVGAVIVWRKPDDWMAIFVSLFLVGFGLAQGELIDALGTVYPISRVRLDALEGLWGWLPFTFFFFLFPNGRFVPAWLRPLAIGWTFWRVVVFIFPTSPVNSYAWPEWVQLLWWVGLMWVPGVAAQSYRYVRVSSPVERQQTKWVVLGIAGTSLVSGVTEVAILLLFPNLATPDLRYELIATIISALAVLLFPLTIGVSVLRYRLWDVDPIINRALVYGVLTVIVVGFYVLVVAGVGALFRAQESFAVSLLAAGLSVVLFHPLRDRLQRGVNRLMYGQRDEPYAVLDRLGERLEALASSARVLSAIAETTAEALRLPYVAIAVRQGDRFNIEAEYCLTTVPPAIQEAPTAQEVFPLMYQSEIVGRLILAPRAPGEPLTPADRRLIENVARQAGAAVRAAGLTADLQRSRERLVNALEEERRRLRRDLHDGLGPALASQGLKLAAAEQLLPSDPAAADALLKDVMSKNEETVAEVRRLVYELRPPALDELGLVGAIRDQVVGAKGNSLLSAVLRVTVEEPPRGLPLLPAAVEIAAYRIALEALTNVARHAQARHCRIRFSLDQSAPSSALQVEVTDDGIGLPDTLQAGVGLTSMRERAEEIGGTCLIEPAKGGGTRVIACLPLGGA